jgi:hypothetical protein
MGSDVGVGGRGVAVGGMVVTVGVAGFPTHPEITNKPAKKSKRLKCFFCVSIQQIIPNNKKTA